MAAGLLAEGILRTAPPPLRTSSEVPPPRWGEGSPPTPVHSVHGPSPAEGKGDLLQALQGLKEFRGLRHRMELVGERDGVRLINNSMCTNPAAVVASSKSISERQHLLIGGQNKGLAFDALRAYLAESGHHAYIYGSDGESISAQLGGEWPVFKTMEDAFRAAVGEARTGEVVMLAPGAASLDQFKDFRERGEAFIGLAKVWIDTRSV